VSVVRVDGDGNPGNPQAEDDFVNLTVEGFYPPTPTAPTPAEETEAVPLDDRGYFLLLRFLLFLSKTLYSEQVFLPKLYCINSRDNQESFYKESKKKSSVVKFYL
jgi:hypothetical protein